MVERSVEAEQAGTGAAQSPAPQGLVDGNYQYWRDHGGEWAEGYDKRKTRQVLYHIQELMLTQYILQHAVTAPVKPMKVLEFGCGVGRHLKNLSKLPDVDVYGYDQSLAMAEGMLRWSGTAWFESHVTVGQPTGKLPYPDKHFDIVYTAEVLVHVRPEHLEGILRELVRVSRGHVLHIETSEHVPLVTNEHSGCWRHDLPATYAKMGLKCEILSSGYLAHQPFRVIVGEPARFTWAPAIIEMYRRLERDMDAGFAAVEGKAGQVDELLRQMTDLRTQAAAKAAAAAQDRENLANEVVRTQAEVEGLNATLQEKTGALAEAARGLGEELARTAALRAELQNALARVEEGNAEVRTLHDRMKAIEEKNRKDRNLAAGLIEERNAFVADVSKHLRV